MLRYKNPVSFFDGKRAMFCPTVEDRIKAPVATESNYTIQFLNQAIGACIVLRIEIEMSYGEFVNIDKNIEAVQYVCQKAIRHLNGLKA